MVKIFFGTTFANDTNGRMVELPDAAQIVRTAVEPGKHGGGIRVDYMVVLTQPQYVDKTYAELDEETKAKIDAEIAAREAEAQYASDEDLPGDIVEG